MKDTKLCVPAVTLSGKDDKKLWKLLSIWKKKFIGMI